jgi:hypothetical protein
MQMEFDMNIEIKVPKRPTATEDIIRTAAKELLKDPVFMGIDEMYAEDIVEAYDSFYDGYELAKELDNRYGWDINIEMVNSLDGMDSIVSNMVREKEREWVKEYDIKPELEVGTKIKQGIIKGVDEYRPATYKVQREVETRKGYYRLVKFEDAEGVNDD